jgi:hypothetical protein
MSGRRQTPTPLRVSRSIAKGPARKRPSHASNRKSARIQKQARQADPILLDCARPTSPDPMAASIMGLMMLAADSAAQRKIGIEYTAAATAALAQMIAVRSSDDD